MSICEHNYRKEDCAMCASPTEEKDVIYESAQLGTCEHGNYISDSCVMCIEETKKKKEAEEVEKEEEEEEEGL